MKYGIIAAMKIEAELIEAAMTDKTSEECGMIKFCTGRIGMNDVILAVCGIGKVFAAMCAQTMIVKYAPDAIINTGIGGTLTKELSIGDVAVSTALVQHDMDTSALGDPIGMISIIDQITLPAAPALTERMLGLLKARGINAHAGIIASGDQFIGSSEKKLWIAETFGAIACEMEGAAIAQVCYVNKVPFCVIRAISDDADSGACDDYPSFAAASAKTSSQIVIDLMSSK